MRKMDSFVAATLLVLVSSTVANAETPDLAQIQPYTQSGESFPFAQVNSVSELSDVDPNSWAFQSLKNVVERYGCLEGYPDKMYRGNKPLSRYEFAAGLNACLDKINDLIATNTSNKASKEDLGTLQRLQDEFRDELATLRSRTDALEAKTKSIESKLFNTNAKLDGSVVMAVTGGGGSSDNTVTSPVSGGPALGDSNFTQNLGGGVRTTSASSANTSFVARTSLNLRASFDGKDELVIRLRGVTGQDLGAAFSGIAGGRGSLFYALGAGNRSYDGSTSNGSTNGTAAVTFDKIRYTTNLFSDSLRVYIGSRIDLFEILDTNSFAGNEEVDFSNGLFKGNPLTTYLFAGPGAGFDWQINNQIALRGAYIAADGGSVNAYGNSGLFGGSYQVTTELEFSPLPTASIKLQYAHLYEQGSVLGTALNSLATAGVTDSVGVNAELALGSALGLFGRFGYGWTGLSGQRGGLDTAQITSTTWQVGFALPKLLGEGNTFAVAYGQPLRANEGRIDNLSLVPSGTEGNIEAYIRFRLNDRLSVTPDFQYYFQGANSTNSSGIAVGTLRATFSF
ncbi:MAG: carbohydrate porin [Anaerolineae bacterium]|nr:carbohydrate porin [Gloeobacterales cyanobacterium ES-bin-313]